MTWKVAGLILLGALAVLGGVLSWRSPSAATTIQAAAAILIGGNLLLMTWLWARARPGSGEATVFPDLILVSASMLVGLLPRLFQAGETLRLSASLASLVLTTLVVVAMLRRRRKLQSAR